MKRGIRTGTYADLSLYVVVVMLIVMPTSVRGTSGASDLGDDGPRDSDTGTSGHHLVPIRFESPDRGKLDERGH